MGELFVFLESLFYGAQPIVFIVNCIKSDDKSTVTCLTGLYSDEVVAEWL